MEKKMSIKDLEKQYVEAEAKVKELYEQLTKAKKEDEDAKRAKLKAEKEARYKEVIDAYENFEELRTNFVNDYGHFTFKTSSDWWKWFFNEV